MLKVYLLCSHLKFWCFKSLTKSSIKMLPKILSFSMTIDELGGWYLPSICWGVTFSTLFILQFYMAKWCTRLAWKLLGWELWNLQDTSETGCNRTIFNLIRCILSAHWKRYVSVIVKESCLNPHHHTTIREWGRVVLLTEKCRMHRNERN